VQEIRVVESATRIAGTPTYIRGVINLRGIIVPIVDLRAKLGFTHAVNAAAVVIILQVEGHVVGVVVDAVSDVVALLPEAIRPAADIGGTIDAGFVTGIAPLEGRLLIVMDIARLLASAGLILTLPLAA